MKAPKYSKLLVIIIILIGARVALPHVGKFYINKALGSSFATYSGRIQDLSLTLLTGSYFIKNLEIRKKNSTNQNFLTIKNLRVHLDWSLLFQGHAVVNIQISDAKVLFVDANEEENKQFGLKDEKTEHWSKAIQAVIPLSIEKIIAKKVYLEFENKKIQGLEKNLLQIRTFEAKNLITPESNKNMLSPIELHGELNKHAGIYASGGINITKKNPHFDIDFKLEKFNLQSTNKLLMNYVPIDVTSGILDLYSEIKGNSRYAKGYAKVFFSDLDIVESSQDFKSTEHFLFELSSGFFNWALTVLTEGRVATEIPLKINKGKFNLDGSKAFWNSLENSVDKISPRFKNI